MACKTCKTCKMSPQAVHARYSGTRTAAHVRRAGGTRSLGGLRDMRGSRELRGARARDPCVPVCRGHTVPHACLPWSTQDPVSMGPLLYAGNPFGFGSTTRVRDACGPDSNSFSVSILFYTTKVVYVHGVGLAGAALSFLAFLGALALAPSVSSSESSSMGIPRSAPSLLQLWPREFPRPAARCWLRSVERAI